MIGWGLLLMLRLAAAEPGPALPADATDEPRFDEAEEVDEVIIVYGEERVRQAREKVIADLKELGYDKLIDKGDRLVLKHETSWKGKVVLHDDGFLQHRRQGVKGTMPDTFFKRASPLVGWVPCLVVPTACVKVGGVVVSKRKLSHVRTRTTQYVAADLQELNARMADLAVDDRVESLPGDLQRCWDDGVALDGRADRLPTYADRRRHLLDYWASRTDTEWGRRVRDVVGSFLRGEVQASSHPITAAEVAQMQARWPQAPALQL